MIVDSSAILAILFGERDAEDLLVRILDAEFAGIGAPTAALAAQPLLCRGDDFRRTDLPLV